MIGVIPKEYDFLLPATITPVDDPNSDDPNDIILISSQSTAIRKNIQYSVFEQEISLEDREDIYNHGGIIFTTYNVFRDWVDLKPIALENILLMSPTIDVDVI